MNSFLRQSTASQSRALGPFISDTDFKTVQTGLTIANTDIKLVVNGGASANKNSGGGTHRVNGVYGVTFDATDTATVGEMEVNVVVAGALAVWTTFVVLEEAVYDALFAASAPGYLQPTTAGRTLDVSAAGNAGIDWANVENPTTAVNLSATNIDVDQVVASVSGAVGSVTGAVGSVTGNVGGNVTGSVGSVVGAVGSVTGNVGGSVASVVGNVGGNVVGSVGSVVGAVGSVTGAVGSVTGNVGGNVVGSVDSVVDPVTVGTMNANVIDAASIATGAFTAAKFAAGAFDAVWTVAARTLTSFGTLAADVWASATRTLTAATNITSTGGTTVPQTGDAYARLGAPVGASVSADIAAVKAQTAAIETDTGTDLPALIVSETNAVQADIAALNNLSAAQVNAEVVDALNVDTYAEPTGVPPATASLQRKISQVYMINRNGVEVTATNKTFLDDGGAGEWKKPLSDDGTTYAEGEGTTP